MSKTSGLRGWVCAFGIVPVAIIAVAWLTVIPGRHRSAARAASAAISTSASNSSTAAHATPGQVQAAYAALPLAFEQNQGQTDEAVKYLARGNGYTLFLTPKEAVFSLHSRSAAAGSAISRRPGAGKDQKNSTAVVRMHLAGANSPSAIEAASPVAGTANYFIGNDQSKWQSGVPRYARVSYRDVYPGVNMAFHGSGRELEFDFVLSPQANPGPIGFQFTGTRAMRTNDSGDLIISSAAGNILLRKPVAYQEQNGARQLVDVKFALKAENEVSFALGDYDRNRELVIDPSVSVSYTYATYLGGSGDDAGYGIAFDSAGNAYVTGPTSSINFPVIAGGHSGANAGTGGTTDVFVTKIAPDGSTLVYSTYVGGSGDDSGNSIAVDSSGDAFVAGGTTSTNFPATTGAFQTALNGTPGNAFVFELNPTGATLKYCTYLGGSGTGSFGDAALGLALDGSGNVYLTGRTASLNFPLSVSPLQVSSAASFVTKLKPAGTGTGDLLFSTYLGGSGSGDFANSIAVGGPSGNVYVTGSAAIPIGPASVPGFQTTNAGGFSDAFVAALNPAGTAYVYYTFLGGSDTDIGNGITVDATGNAYVTGQTASSTSSSTPFPLKSALQTAFGGPTYDAFVTELNPAGTALVYSTYLGGSGNDFGASVAVDGTGNAYVTGQTASSNFPSVVPTQAALGGANDAFVSEISAGGAALLFSTYLGGTLDEDDGGKFGAIAVDSAGANIYVTGNTLSTDFRAISTATVFQSSSAGLSDAIVVKYAQTATAPTFSLAATALSPGTVSPGGSATSTVSVTPPNGFGGTVTLTCAVSPTPSGAPTCAAATATTATPATLTVHTTAAAALMRQPNSNMAPLYAMFLPMGGMALLGFGFRSKGSLRNRLFGALLVGLLLSGFLLMPACGGGGSHTTGGGGTATPAGTYTITVSGTATGATQTGTPPALTLVVN